MNTQAARKQLQAVIEGVEWLPLDAEVIAHEITSKATYAIGQNSAGKQVARLASGNPSARGWLVEVTTPDQNKVEDDDRDWEPSDYSLGDVVIAINDKTIFDSEAE